MIKRLLLFGVLVAAGFYALFAFVGDRETGKKLEMEETDQRPGVSIQNENNNKRTDVVIRGRLEIPVKREVELPDGSRRLLTLYKLDAEDSEPTDNNTQLLHGVTVQFFDIEDKGPNPHGRLIGTMKARRARVQLSQNKEGAALVAEDKQMEFEDVTFKTEEDAPVSNATMTLARAFAINGPKEFRIWTPTDDIPVRIVARGKDGFEIRGLGMQAWIPATRGAEGRVKMEESGDFRFIVAKMPRLVRGDTRASARGSLEYRELLETGVARVSMRDDVEVRGLASSQLLQQPAPSSSDANVESEVVARGRRLDAVLVRSDNPMDKSDDMVWNRIVLRGEPCTLDGQGSKLTCKQLDVIPDAAGDPYWIIASGDKPSMYDAERKMRVDASHRIHLIRASRQHASLLAGFGLPSQAMPRGMDQVVIFEGPARVFSELDQLDARASEAVTVLRSSEGGDNVPVTVFGRGDVVLSTPEWVMSGNRGFRMQETPRPGSTKEEPRIDRQLRLGPVAGGRSHHYRVERRATAKSSKAGKDQTQKRLAAVTQSFVAVGTGSCRVRTGADKAGNLHLVSAREDIKISLTDGSGEMTHVRDLFVNFHELRGVVDLVARGRECRVKYLDRDGWVHALASVIESPCPGVLRLQGRPLAQVRQDALNRLVEGHKILIRRVSEKGVLIRSTGAARIRLLHDSGDEAGKRNSRSSDKLAQTADLELRAGDIRLVPFLSPAYTHEMHRRALPAGVSVIADYPHRSNYLLADGNVRLIQRDTTGRIVGRGFGSHLVLRFSQEAQSLDGRLDGDIARLLRMDKNDREHIAEARRIRFASDKRGEHVLLVPLAGVDPRLTLPSSTASGPGLGGDDGSSTTVVCRGPIAVDPERVRFLGPLAAKSRDKDGNLDPRGLSMTASSMVMDRDKDGNVTYMQASKDIRFHFQNMDGKADDVSVDLAKNLLIARGRAENAVLRKPNGQVVSAAQVNYNYRTKRTQSWNSRYEVVTGK